MPSKTQSTVPVSAEAGSSRNACELEDGEMDLLRTQQQLQQQQPALFWRGGAYKWRTITNAYLKVLLRLYQLHLLFKKQGGQILVHLILCT
jgi:hypothetical protein